MLAKRVVLGSNPHPHLQPLPSLKKLGFNKKDSSTLLILTEGRYTPYLNSRDNIIIQGGNVLLFLTNDHI